MKTADWLRAAAMDLQKNGADIIAIRAANRLPGAPKGRVRFLDARD